MPNTLGIHWIATTHGSWLHGDVRGSWRDGKLLGPDPFHENAVRKRMTHDAVTLSRTEIICAAAEIGRTVTEHNHRAYTATFHPTHLHIVFAPLPEDVTTTIARLKKRSADLILRVRRNRGDTRRHLWTQKQFPVFIFTETHLHNAIQYVRQHNTRTGKPPDPYDWITPLRGDPPRQHAPQKKPGQHGPAI